MNECLAKEGAPGFAEIQKSAKEGVIHVHPDIPETDEMIRSLSRLLDPGEAQAIKLGACPRIDCPTAVAANWSKNSVLFGK
ncbi:hypothetical protein [Endozoicomonas sp. SCSIO W0465]|uniref:hypothetical protein n=1 Tax=Endozoicomonas sp. SCSIO W0465 TaxID=2918516 RepID=UPI0020763085|nr:hypothetical protein [Endozoicomonas sp. SCSIO W0465]USE37598.1 hypothetical protein MJO57_05140 [Endozoicomonas sp. SCSIO W0465]